MGWLLKEIKLNSIWLQWGWFLVFQGYSIRVLIKPYEISQSRKRIFRQKPPKLQALCPFKRSELHNKQLHLWGKNLGVKWLASPTSSYETVLQWCNPQKIRLHVCWRVLWCLQSTCNSICLRSQCIFAEWNAKRLRSSNGARTPP